ncbi:hypothetical protein RUM43_012741 [Polyplax serrata]|uniref:Phenylalanine--tRNA ligase, mitochondrial n=1 Tax=Polyplax serrata TaxID=468196 RepID=A0AAN8S9Q1_POLSC
MIIRRFISTTAHRASVPQSITMQDVELNKDSYTNVTPKILSYLDKKLHLQQNHPICMMKDRILHFMHNKFVNTRGNAIFSMHDNLNPIVTVRQNFDSLLVPHDHPSRTKTDCYYINESLMLRAHMTAHQAELIQMGLDNFLMVGDVYRRDKINSTHYPVFHQMDAVRLQLPLEGLIVKEKKPTERTSEKQEIYTLDATKVVEKELKGTLEGLMREIFGEKVEFKWVDAYFPFTHPSWELEILVNGEWMEMLGCGVMEHEILDNAGCGDRIGWAFGLGLERLAMTYYSIPDIRVFWSNDSGFHSQFKNKTFMDRFAYKPFSIFPQCPLDLSFWVKGEFCPNDFHDLAREVIGDIVEQVDMIDHFINTKTGKESYCFRIVYRSMFKTLTKKEAVLQHSRLAKKLTEKYDVIIR